MLKVYSINKNIIELIEPVNDLYNVVEGFDYVLEYQSDIRDDAIFIEDFPISLSDYEIKSSTHIKTVKKKFFIDYFGYACLRVNNEQFLFNIKVEKFKLSEIEDIFTFLWSKEEKIFDNFFSKSTQTVKFDKLGASINNTSKYIVFANYFLETFEMMLHAFSRQPHTKLKEIRTEGDFTNSSINQYSVDWVLQNLDTLKFSTLPIYSPEGVSINGRTAIITTIGTEEKINSFDTYENSIILGALSYLQKAVQQLKKEVTSIVNVEMLQNKELVDINDLKKITYLKIYQESSSIEKRCKKLLSKYQGVFKNTRIKEQSPQLTSVFSSKVHYQKAYKLIRNLFNYKIALNGEFRLLNITKLSQLYEVYNFHILVDAVTEILKDDAFELNIQSTRDDMLSNIASFRNNEFSINIYYEGYISNAEIIDLVRIDKGKKKFYCPDHIIEIIRNVDGLKKYWILDSKYSKQSIVRDQYLNKCVYKYILNTGFNNDIYKKIEGLVLLFPSGKSYSCIQSDYYKPTLDMILSKPNYENDLFNYIINIIKSNVPQNLININQIFKHHSLFIGGHVSI